MQMKIQSSYPKKGKGVLGETTSARSILFQVGKMAEGHSQASQLLFLTLSVLC